MTSEQQSTTGGRAVTANPPTQTPECEASTCSGISTPEPVELYNTWPSWMPLLVIAVMVVCCAGFAIGRIAGW